MAIRFLCAPNAFKESIPAVDAALAMKRGILRVFPDAVVECIPIADGGDGTAKALSTAMPDAKIEHVTVKDPLGRMHDAQFVFGTLNKVRTAIVEMALASGLALVTEEERDVMRSSSAGTGELIRAALDAGAVQILIGLGGSATNDCGAGLLQELGAKLLDSHGQSIGPGPSGLEHLAAMDLSTLDDRLGPNASVKLLVMCDVQSPLTGKTGASFVFGPQKGARIEDLEHLDTLLEKTGRLLEKECNRSLIHTPGSGAAGGTAAALLAVGARLTPGFQMISELLGVERAIKQSDYVFTGEGKFDSQSEEGKGPSEILKLARAHKKECFVLAGSVEGDAENVFQIAGPNISRAESMRRASELIEDTARKVCEQIRTRTGTDS